MFYKKAYTEVPAIISFNSLLKELHTKTLFISKRKRNLFEDAVFLSTSSFLSSGGLSIVNCPHEKMGA